MKFSHHAMGTTFEIFIADQKEAYARQAAGAVFAEIDRLERILSRFDPRSDVGQLHRLKPGQSLKVGIELIECLKIAAAAYIMTNGAFDVTIAPLLGNREGDSVNTQPAAEPGCTGFNRFYFAENGAVFFNTQTVVHDNLPAAGNKQKLLRGEPLTVTIVSDPGVASTGCGSLRLDFGGIGKGYALDKSLDILADWGIDRALLHGGTSTAIALGDGPDNPAGKSGWPVGTAGDTLYLHNMALSGSGKEVKGEHILDPKTGKKARGHVSVWVSHSSAALADALSTALIVMGSEEAAQFCRENPGVWVKVVEHSGAVKVYNPPNRLAKSTIT